MVWNPCSRGGASVRLRALLALALVPVAFPALMLAQQAASTANAPATEPVTTFAKDIAPLLERSCQNCHRPDGVAPMSLVTYEDARPWARAMKLKTSIGPKAGV